MAFTLGIDTSTWQDSSETAKRIDWLKPAQHGVKFVINRAAFVATKDDDFAYNWNEQRGRYLRGAYGFLGYWPGAASIAAQARALTEILKPDPGEMPVVWVDMEKANSTYPDLPARGSLLSMLESYMKGVEDGLGMGTGLYTNLAGIMKLSPVPAWLLSKPLWLAWPVMPTTGETAEAYIQRTGTRPPLMEWDGYKVWQYSWKGPGLEMGMESNGLDMNYFNGDENTLRRWCNVPELPKEPEMSNPMGLFTRKAGWTAVNPNYNFVMGAANTKNTADPNPNIKPIELEAAAGKIPFLLCWELYPWLYSEQQWGEPNWPDEAHDYIFQNFKKILEVRSYQAVVINVMTYKDKAGKDEDKAFVAYCAKSFLDRVGKWLKANRPLVPLILGTSNDFIKAHAPNINNWAHNFYSMAVQPTTLGNDSYPLPGAKPAYLGASTECEWWRYYERTSSDTALILFRGAAGYPATVEGMAAWLNYNQTPKPPEDPKPPVGDYATKQELAALAAQFAQLKAAYEQHAADGKAHQHTHGGPQ